MVDPLTAMEMMTIRMEQTQEMMENLSTSKTTRQSFPPYRESTATTPLGIGHVLSVIYQSVRQCRWSRPLQLGRKPSSGLPQQERQHPESSSPEDGI